MDTYLHDGVLASVASARSLHAFAGRQRRRVLLLHPLGRRRADARHDVAPPLFFQEHNVRA